MCLIEHLKQIPDFGRQPRYRLWVILLLVVMGTIRGAQGDRALEEVVVRHQSALLELLELPYQRLPSFSTLWQHGALRLCRLGNGGQRLGNRSISHQ